MSLPQPRAFKSAIDTRFPEVDEMPKDMQEPYRKIQENLERMNDRVGGLEDVDIATVTDFRQNITQIEATSFGFDEDDAISDFLNAINA